MSVSLSLSLSLSAPSSRLIAFSSPVRDSYSLPFLLSLFASASLYRRQVMSGVPQLLHEVQIEATFPDGRRCLLTASPVSFCNILLRTIYPLFRAYSSKLLSLSFSFDVSSVLLSSISVLAVLLTLCILLSLLPLGRSVHLTLYLSLQGTKLVTVHSPIAASDGNLELALRGSFLPIPSLEDFEPKEGEEDIVLSNIIPDNNADNIVINAGRPITRIKVTNLSDRAIQVPSVPVKELDIFPLCSSFYFLYTATSALPFVTSLFPLSPLSLKLSRLAPSSSSARLISQSSQNSIRLRVLVPGIDILSCRYSPSLLAWEF